MTGLCNQFIIMTYRSQGPGANYFFSTQTFYKKVIYAQCNYNKHLLTYINEIRTKSSIMKLEIKSKMIVVK